MIAISYFSVAEYRGVDPSVIINLEALFKECHLCNFYLILSNDNDYFKLYFRNYRPETNIFTDFSLIKSI